MLLNINNENDNNIQLHTYNTLSLAPSKLLWSVCPESVLLTLPVLLTCDVLAWDVHVAARGFVGSACGKAAEASWTRS